MAEKTAVLQASCLCKRFVDGDRRTDALRDVSFALHKQEFLGVVGESGSGKSTLLRAVSGLITIDKGEIRLSDQVVTDRGPRVMGQHLQMIFQDPKSSFDPRMTMERSILESGRGKKVSEEIRRLVRAVQLDPALLARRPAALSGGQCQRMAIVRALYSGVRILLCDEITSALDVSSQAQIVTILKQLRERSNLSLLFVSHDIALVRMLCDRVMVMRDGCVVETGSVEQVIGDPQDEYTKALIQSAARQSL